MIGTSDKGWVHRKNGGGRSILGDGGGGGGKGGPMGQRWTLYPGVIQAQHNIYHTLTRCIYLSFLHYTSSHIALKGAWPVH